MKLINLPVPLDIVHDAGTDFGKLFSIQGLPFGSSWTAKVDVGMPSGQTYAYTPGAGLTFTEGKLRWSLTADELKRYAGKPGISFSIALTSPDGVTKRYWKGGLTIQS